MSDKGVNELFVQAYAAMKNPALDGVNPHFKNRFASLQETLRVVREACEPVGIAYTQTLRDANEHGAYLVTAVRAGGEALPLSTMWIANENNPQAYGSKLTYAKRQLAQLDWGIAGEDDDAEQATAQPQQPAQRKAKPKAQPQQAQQPANPELAQAKQTLANAIKAWADATNGNAQSAMAGITKRPDYAENNVNPEWFLNVAYEFQEAVKETK